MSAENSNHELKTSRVEALTDSIYAFSMTLLIIGFEVVLNRPHKLNNGQLTKELFSLWPDFLHYVLGFIILGAFWIEHHHQFHFIKRTDSKLLFINVIGLMFIALIPFSTLIVGDYGELRIAALMFETNLLIAGLIMYAHWIYVTRERRLTDGKLEPHIVEFYKRRNLVIPIISIIAIFLSLINPRFGTVFYFTAPFALIWYKLKHPEHIRR